MVVDSAGRTGLVLSVWEHGGSIFVNGKPGKGIAKMTVTEHGGTVQLWGNDFKGAVGMGIQEHGGYVSVYSKGIIGSAKMSTNEHGGRVDVYRRYREKRASMNIATGRYPLGIRTAIASREIHAEGKEKYYETLTV